MAPNTEKKDCKPIAKGDQKKRKAYAYSDNPGSRRESNCR